MSESVTNDLLLEHLKRIQAGQARLIADVGDLKIRMTALEENTAATAQSLAAQSRRIDRMEARLDRIERRLDLTEGV